MTMKSCGNCDHKFVCGLSNDESNCNWWEGWHVPSDRSTELPDLPGVEEDVVIEFIGEHKGVIFERGYLVATHFENGVFADSLDNSDLTGCIVAWHDLPKRNDD